MWQPDYEEEGIPEQHAEYTTLRTHTARRPPDDTRDNEDGYPADDVSAPRAPRSVVRYHEIAPATATTRMRVIQHQGAAPKLRASRSAPSMTTGLLPAAARQQRRPPLALAAPRQQPRAAPRMHPHVLIYLGAGMVLAFSLLVLGSFGWQWWQQGQENARYGTPRTYQTDADVGHGGVSHFTVENLGGRIIIIEIHPNNFAQSRLYQGPVLEGAGVDQDPATARFADVNGDHLPDMIVSINHTQYVFLNASGGFRPPTPSDKISSVLP